MCINKFFQKITFHSASVLVRFRDTAFKTSLNVLQIIINIFADLFINASILQNYQAKPRNNDFHECLSFKNTKRQNLIFVCVKIEWGPQ